MTNDGEHMVVNNKDGDGSGECACAAATENSCSTKAEVPSSLPLVSDKGMKPPAKNCFRLVILGSSRVGKTSLVSR